MTGRMRGKKAKTASSRQVLPVPLRHGVCLCAYASRPGGDGEGVARSVMAEHGKEGIKAVFINRSTNGKGCKGQGRRQQRGSAYNRAGGIKAARPTAWLERAWHGNAARDGVMNDGTREIGGGWVGNHDDEQP